MPSQVDGNSKQVNPMQRESRGRRVSGWLWPVGKEVLGASKPEVLKHRIGFRILVLKRESGKSRQGSDQWWYEQQVDGVDIWSFVWNPLPFNTLSIMGSSLLFESLSIRMKSERDFSHTHLQWGVRHMTMWWFCQSDVSSHGESRWIRHNPCGSGWDSTPGSWQKWHSFSAASGPVRSVPYVMGVFPEQWWRRFGYCSGMYIQSGSVVQ